MPLRWLTLFIMTSVLTSLIDVAAPSPLALCQIEAHMSTCNTPPKNKKEFVVKLGSDLHAKYGKKRFYSVKETKDSMTSLNYPIDFFCWGHAIFNAPLDFQRYHQSIGETCDQADMKTEMGNAFTDASDGSWFDIDLSWLEWPDIDFGSLFDFTP